MTDPTDLSALVQDLTATRDAMARAVAQMRRRNLITAVLSVLSIVVLIGYLGYAYFRYGGEVTPELVAVNVSASFRDKLPDAQAAVTKKLRDRAPQQVADAFAKLKAMPEQYAVGLQADAKAKLDATMPEVQERMVAAMKQAIDQAKTPAAAGAAVMSDDARLQAMLASVGDTYAKQTLTMVDQTHMTYSADASLFLDYMDRLATSPNLDRRDRLHRDMFQTVFALVRQRAANSPPGGSPVDLTIFKGGN